MQDFYYLRQVNEYVAPPVLKSYTCFLGHIAKHSLMCLTPFYRFGRTSGSSTRWIFDGSNRSTKGRVDGGIIKWVSLAFSYCIITIVLFLCHDDL